MNLLEMLSKLVSTDQISINETILEQHSKGESFHPSAMPDAVVYPLTTDDVKKVVTFASKEHIPIVPFGVGSSLEGHIIPYYGGITLDFSKMNAILEVNPSDFLVKVQPGVTRNQLNKELKKYGLFFPVDPGADATIGGMVATNASGTTAVRYGVMRDQVRDLEVVLASGKIIRTGGLAAKSSSGYHLNGLFAGSEGTLGCFTEIILKVHGIPECKMTARATFSKVEAAIEAVSAIRAANIAIARCEFVDARSVQQVNDYHDLSYPVLPTLFLEFHGNEAGLKQDIDFTKEILEDNGCSDFQFETDSKLSYQLWEIRHNLLYAFLHKYPRKNHMSTDVCLPISKLADALQHARDTIDRIGMDGAVFGHVGDGNFHCLIMVDPTSEMDLRKASQINEIVVNHAISHRGTCTGEHGVGVGKIKYQQKEHGEAYEIMKAIKQLLDPTNIMNPGKVIEK